jgi:predicted short-subunit dehydrogenase-like oxidoreductase (DUF2520 family)
MISGGQRPTIRRFALVGAGNAGSAVARALASAGIQPALVVSRSDASATALAESLPGPPTTRPLDRLGDLRDVDLIVVATPDSAIAETSSRIAGQLGGTGARPGFAWHLSGFLPAGALSPLQAVGLRPASFHPLQTFPDRAGGPERLRGTLVALEGDPEAVAQAESVAALLGAQTVRLAPGDKPLYHAAAVLAAGGVVALLSRAVELFSSLGIPRAQATPALTTLAAAAVEAVRARGPAAALTGPVVRGDVNTVLRELPALDLHPDDRELYRLLARHALSLASGRVGDEDHRRLREILEKRKC